MQGFGPCSAICGGGHQKRRVECVQDMNRGPSVVKLLPDDQCQQPIPERSLLCNLKDCPASWETTPWTQVKFEPNHHFEILSLGSTHRNTCHQNIIKWQIKRQAM